MKFRLVLSELKEVQKNGFHNSHYAPVPGLTMRFTLATMDEVEQVWGKIEHTIVRDIQSRAEAARVEAERRVDQPAGEDDEPDLTGG